MRAWPSRLGLGALVIAMAFAPDLFATIPSVEIPPIGRVVLAGRFACADRCDGDILYGDFDGDGWRDYA